MGAVIGSRPLGGEGEAMGEIILYWPKWMDPQTMASIKLSWGVTLVWCFLYFALRYRGGDYMV
jgi:hypothetical protein